MFILKIDFREERPKEVDNRETPGHWEMDTVVSKKGGSPARVLSITERTTRWQINVKIKTGETKSVIEMLDKLEKKLGEKFSFVFKTITVDNGSEFADVEHVWTTKRSGISGGCLCHTKNFVKFPTPIY